MVAREARDLVRLHQNLTAARHAVCEWEAEAEEHRLRAKMWRGLYRKEMWAVERAQRETAAARMAAAATVARSGCVVVD